MDNIEKPLSVARVEFIQSLVDLINSSNLPPFVIETILKDMYNDVRLLSKQQFDADLKRYQEMLQQITEQQETEE